MGGPPAGAVLGQRASGPQAVERAVGLARLVPGVQHHRRAALTAQVLLATREARLAGGAEAQGQEETGVAQEERIEGVRHGKHRVEGGRGEQRCAPRCHPLGLWSTSDMWDRGDSGTRYTHSAQSHTAAPAPHAPPAVPCGRP